MTTKCATGSFTKRNPRNSPFNPPKFEKEYPKANNDFLSVAAAAEPWYPTSIEFVPTPKSIGASLTTPSRNDSFSFQFSSRIRNAFSGVNLSETSLFSFQTSPISTVFHCISDSVAERKIYPLYMILSARKDASHTPLGVLQWCQRKYQTSQELQIPSHLVVSITEASESEKSTEALISGNKSTRAVTPEGQQCSKLISMLCCMTSSEFEEMQSKNLIFSLLEAPDVELNEVVTEVFERVVKEPDFGKLYAKLLSDQCHQTVSLEPSTNEQRQKNPLSIKISNIVTSLCDHRLPVRFNITDDDNVDRTTGELLSEEELREKKVNMKRKIVGSLKFLAELINHDVVAESIMEFVLKRFFYEDQTESLKDLDDSTAEFFSTFLKDVAPKLFKYDTSCLEYYFAVAEAIQQTHRCPRVRSMMEELEKLRLLNNWPKGDLSERKYLLTKCSHSPSTSGGEGISSSSTSFEVGKLSSPKRIAELNQMGSPSGCKPGAEETFSFSGSSLEPEIDSRKERSSISPTRTVVPFNLLYHYYFHHDDKALKIFADMSAEGKRECIFGFLGEALQDASINMPKSVDLLLYLTVKCNLMPLTLSCIMISFMRDKLYRHYAKGSLALLTLMFRKLTALIDYSSRSLKQKPEMKIFAVNYFNLLFFTMPHAENIEHLVSLAYSSYKESVENYPNDTCYPASTAVLSSASLLVLRFAFTLFPIDKSGGRRQPPEGHFSVLKRKFPNFENAIEIQLSELILLKPINWEKRSIQLIVKPLQSISLTLFRRVALFTGLLDVLLTFTAVSSHKDQPLLPLSLAGMLISQVVQKLGDDEIYQTAVVLELLFHCNMYSLKYGVHKSSSAIDLFQNFLLVLQRNGAIQKKSDVLRNLQFLLGENNMKSPFGVYFTSLATKNSISVSCVTHLLNDNYFTLYSSSENGAQLSPII